MYEKQIPNVKLQKRKEIFGETRSSRSQEEMKLTPWRRDGCLSRTDRKERQDEEPLAKEPGSQ